MEEFLSELIVLRMFNLMDLLHYLKSINNLWKSKHTNVHKRVQCTLDYEKVKASFLAVTLYCKS